MSYSVNFKTYLGYMVIDFISKFTENLTQNYFLNDMNLFFKKQIHNQYYGIIKKRLPE